MFKELAFDFINLFFPDLCKSCGSLLIKQESHICTGCVCKLPKTNFHLDQHNSMAMLFWGRVRIEDAAAMYYFEKGSKCRKLLHQIKYRRKKELAMFLGKMYGNELSLEECFTEPELLIPVPLHPLREKTRGFNQSEWFAKGLGQSMNKEVANDLLVRLHGTETQTSKSRIERWENVENCFAVNKEKTIENKHLLLVDDVVTTGATLEACATELIKAPGVRVSIVTIAFA